MVIKINIFFEDKEDKDYVKRLVDESLDKFSELTKRSEVTLTNSKTGCHGIGVMFHVEYENSKLSTDRIDILREHLGLLDSLF